MNIKRNLRAKLHGKNGFVDVSKKNWMKSANLLYKEIDLFQ